MIEKYTEGRKATPKKMKKSGSQICKMPADLNFPYFTAALKHKLQGCDVHVMRNILWKVTDSY